MSGIVSKPFTKPPLLSGEIRRAFEENVIFGTWEPGVRLIESDLAQQHGVSRAAVREALIQLEADQLVVRKPPRGLWVAPISVADLDDIYRCRMPLEGLAAEEATCARVASDVVELRQRQQTMVEAFEQGDTRAYFHASVAVSARIHAICPNQLLRRLLASVGKPALRYRFLIHATLPHLMTLSRQGNAAIIDAIEAGDGPAARRQTEDLVHASWQAMRELLLADPGAVPGDLSQSSILTKEGSHCYG